MSQQEEGWPLGLQPLNVRVGLVRNNGFSGSSSFNTLLSGSPTSSTVSSSDLDTESTGSFFHDRSTTLGSLIGVSSFLNLSRRSAIHRNQETVKDRKNYRYRAWCFFSMCPRDTTDAETVKDNNTPSLGQFLAFERRAATDDHRRSTSQSPLIYGPDELALAQADREQNSLFVDGRIAPPRSINPWHPSSVGRECSRGVEKVNCNGPAMILFPCICGQPSIN